MNTPKEIQEEKVRNLVWNDNGRIGIYKDFAIKWPKFKRLVDDVINKSGPKFNRSKFIKTQSHWRKIFVDFSGDYDYEWWIELEEIIQIVISDLHKKTTNNIDINASNDLTSVPLKLRRY